MESQLTLNDIQLLKESLNYSIVAVENSPNHTHGTYPQKREKISELEALKNKLNILGKEIQDH